MSAISHAVEDRRAYEALRDAGNRAAQQGHFDEALDRLTGAHEWATEHGDADLVDRAFCNLSGVLISLERGDQVIGPLREILLRSTDEVNCRLAAYNIAFEYEVRREHKKSLFYARIARDRTSNLAHAEPSWVASTHNLIASCMVADSRFEEAVPEYRKAIEADPGAHPVRRGLAERNLGYCQIVLGNYAEGFSRLLSSVRVARKFGAWQEEMLGHLDLCFAYLEIEKYRPARRHGDRALLMAETNGQLRELKNALYLLGETANLMGDAEAAHAYFSRLQKHFPDSPFLVDFLLAIDVRKMINLRA
jgi:tetratricopeptide (TPR) repeat protein